MLRTIRSDKRVVIEDVSKELDYETYREAAAAAGDRDRRLPGDRFPADASNAQASDNQGSPPTCTFCGLTNIDVPTLFSAFPWKREALYLPNGTCVN